MSKPQWQGKARCGEGFGGALKKSVSLKLETVLLYQKTKAGVGSKTFISSSVIKPRRINIQSCHGVRGLIYNLNILLNIVANIIRIVNF